MSGAPFIVWSPEGEASPKVVHQSHKQAHFAAHVMAKRFPGQRFFVMSRAGAGAFVEPTIEHYSDCAVNNAPAYEPGPCDCGGYPAQGMETGTATTAGRGAKHDSPVLNGDAPKGAKP